MKNVTPIDMLPELEDLEGGNVNTNQTFPGAKMIPNSEVDKMSRYVRDGHVLHPDSGMIPYMEPKPSNTHIEKEYEHSIPEVVMTNNKHSGPTCLEVAEHIASCPICSKFYNNDKTVYIIAIVMLAIVCILLLKRVLDV